MSLSCGDSVTWTRPGPDAYPVPGTIKGFLLAVVRRVLVDAANLEVTADTGLYEEGTIVTVPVAELEEAAP